MLFLIIFHGSLQLFIIKIFIARHSKEIHQMIEEGIVENDLLLFKFHKDEISNNAQHIEWIKEDEFRMDGEMYDVVRKEIAEDTVYIYCFQDEKESVLYANMKRILKRLNEDDPNSLNTIIRINNLLSKYYSGTFNELNYSCFNDQGIKFYNKVFKPFEREQDLITPPPQS